MQRFIAAGVGLFYSLLLTLGGMAATGLGHGTGTGIFMALALVPFPLVFWPVVAMMLTRSGPASMKRYVIFLLVLHYLGFAIYLLTLHSQDYQDFSSVWESAPLSWTVYVMIYLAGQVFIWWTVALGKSRRGTGSAAH